MRFVWNWIILTGAGAIAAGPAAAADRELGAHLHGHGALNLVIEGQVLWAELVAPGADIVGFEHAAETEADQAVIADAKARLGKPETVFVLPKSAGCAPEDVSVALESDAADAEHGHDAHHDDKHHDDAAQKHAHDKEHDDDAHHDEKHHDDGHDEKHHDEAHHGESNGGTHSEFHVRYKLTCADAAQVDTITFSYFDNFAGAEELRVTVVTNEGQKVYEVERANASVRLGES